MDHPTEARRSRTHPRRLVRLLAAISLLSFSLLIAPPANAEEGAADGTAIAADAASRAPADIGVPDAEPAPPPPAPVDPPPVEPPPVEPAPVDPPPVEPPPVEPPPVEPPPVETPPVETPPVETPPVDPPAAAPAAPVTSSSTAAGAAAKAPATAAEPLAATAPGRPVVVCKYVRKPNAAELLHHVVIVNSNGLLGVGFTGTFPFAFSDAHFNSLALRFASPGEQAKDVPLSSCPTREEPPPPPPPPPPPGGNPGGPITDTPGAVLDPGGSDGGALGDTGAPAQLAPLVGMAVASLMLGAWLVLRGRQGFRPVG